MSTALILASASPRRRELLGRLGLHFEVVPAEVDESLRPGESPRVYASRIAEAKARAVAEQHPEAWVLGADTIVVVGEEILGKPENAEDAARMLGRLGGHRHLVYTATCLVRPGAEPLRRVIVTEVAMRHLESDDISRYLDSGEWHGKAGAYAAQGLAAAFIREIHGSYTNVVGLPLAEVAIDLKPLLS
jgi:septum formation protein